MTACEWVERCAEVYESMGVDQVYVDGVREAVRLMREFDRAA